MSDIFSTLQVLNRDEYHSSVMLTDEEAMFQHKYKWMFPAAEKERTDNPDLKAGSVLHVLDLEHQLIFSRVISLCWADEQDAVHIWVADVDHLGVNRLTILVPGCDRAWLTLEDTEIIHCSGWKDKYLRFSWRNVMFTPLRWLMTQTLKSKKITKMMPQNQFYT